MDRVASKAEPTYEALIEEVRRSPSVTPDETGWRVGGKLWWMWAFSTSQVTVYSIQPGRGFEQAATVLGADFAGFLVRDGWSIYRQFVQALHQSCLSHLLRRCREMILVAGKGEAEFPRTVQTILQQCFAAARSSRPRTDQRTRSSGEPAGNWKRDWIGPCNVAIARRGIAAWPTICCGSERPCLRS